MTAPVVSLLRQTTYDPDALLDAMRRVLEPLGGMQRFVRPGAAVLLKPNLLRGRTPDCAVTTHPSVVRAAAQLIREAGAARIMVGDSPGYGTCRAAARTAGIADVADALGLELLEFTAAENTDPERIFARLELAREALDADVVINLPKMKTHCQMRMTLAVKNMFGTVPGTRKFQWHYRAGRDRLIFARMINQICRTVQPALSILDAVYGMDGHGPGSGRARPVGFLGAAADPWALDAVVMDIIGQPREDLYTLAVSGQDGIHAWHEARVVGAKPEELTPADWQMPAMQTLQMHGGFIDRRLPAVGRWLRTRITPLPEPKPECVACGHCVDICPAKAMRIEDNRVRINEAECIRCYCCHELCPHGLMDLRAGGLLQKLLRLG